MEPTAVAAYLAKPAAKKLMAFLGSRVSKNDDQLKKEREEAALDWAAEVRGAIPQVVAYLNTRIDDLDSRLDAVYADPQFGRIFTNFTFEAAREAIDERRRMLAHAAVGIVDPDISVERKARVERTLRALDPIDVLTLYAASRIPGGLDALAPMAKFLYDAPSGDILASCGCVRMEPDGGGAGQGVWNRAQVTQIGSDVLLALRTYTRTTPLPFEVPGRELPEGARAEAVAQEILRAIPGLMDFILSTNSRTRRVDRSYQRSRKWASTPTLGFSFHEWSTWKPRAEDLRRGCEGTELAVTIRTQPYRPTETETYDVLCVDISGPDDLLRYLADECDAPWY